jgi:hypothetical protein
VRSWTYSEMKEKVMNDLDLEDEDFITAEEFLGYFNEAIDDVEAKIHTLYEDYFLTTGYLSLVNGTADYAFPSDIYANKLRKLFYSYGGDEYEVTKIKRLSDIPDVEAGDRYRYLPINTTASGYRIRIYPTPALTDSTAMSVWYLRNAKRLSLDADVCDIPEFANVIMQQVKVRCYEKEGHPNTLKAMQDLKEMEELMVTTLTNMVDDENDQVEMDLSFYEDFDSGM